MSLPASLPNLKLVEFSGDPLQWPKGHGALHAANIDNSLKMKHLETLVTGKTKEVIAGLGHPGDMYDVACSGSYRTTETNLHFPICESVRLCSSGLILESSFKLCTSSDANELCWRHAVIRRPE